LLTIYLDVPTVGTKRQWQPLFGDNNAVVNATTDGGPTSAVAATMHSSAADSAKRTRFFATDSPPSSPPPANAAANNNILGPSRITRVSEINPVPDFRAMIEDHDPTIADRAIDEMEKIIEKILAIGINVAALEKALQCVEALRLGCVKNEEPERYNSFYAKLVKLSKQTGKDEFVGMMNRASVGLIPTMDDDDDAASTTSRPHQPSAPQRQVQSIVLLVQLFVYTLDRCHLPPPPFFFPH
jgi:hypothetical protein